MMVKIKKKKRRVKPVFSLHFCFVFVVVSCDYRRKSGMQIYIHADHCQWNLRLTRRAVIILFFDV